MKNIVPVYRNVFQRKSIRLKNYNYSQNGYYFVTVCTQNRERLFGEIMDGKMVVNEYGKIVRNVLDVLPKRYEYVEMDVSQIMPNHAHFIIAISNDNPVGAHHDAPLRIWQRNFYEHIIRAETDLNKIREYIQSNPQNWNTDKDNI